MSQVSATALALSLLIVPPVFHAASAPDPATPAGTVHAFLTRAEPALESYVAERTLVGWGDSPRREARVEVESVFDRAARRLDYTILREEGSGIIRSRGLQAVLRGEAESVASGQMAESALTPENYAITFGAVEPDGLHRLLLAPLRRDSLLLAGAMFVTPTGELKRVEGRAARNPSFWTTRVDITRDYAQVGGVTVLVRMESRVRTRLFGGGGMVMTYTYRKVNGTPIPPDEADEPLRSLARRAAAASGTPRAQ